MTEAVAKYNPAAPPASPAALRGLLSKRREEVQSILPKGVTVDQLERSFVVTISENPDLMRCSQESLFVTYLRGAQMGLEFGGPLGHLYAVPFGKKAQLIPGYRGLAQLCYDAGARRVEADVVHENDHFEFAKGAVPRLDHRPALVGDRGAPVAAWALIELANGALLVDVMSKDEIEKVRASANSKNSPAWKEWWGEMAKKTVLRRRIKLASLRSKAIETALEVDNEDFTQATGEIRRLAGVDAPSAPAPIVEQPQESLADALTRDVKRANAAQEAGKAVVEVASDLELADEEAQTSALTALTPTELDNYTKKGLLALAKKLNLPHSEGWTVDQLREAIISARDKAGGGEGSSPPSPEPPPAEAEPSIEDWAEACYLVVGESGPNEAAQNIVEFDRALLETFEKKELSEVDPSEIGLLRQWARRMMGADLPEFAG